MHCETGFRAGFAFRITAGVGRKRRAASLVPGSSREWLVAPMSHASIEYRLRHRTRREGDCWIWTGAKTRDGYGRTTVRGKDTMTHRAVYEHFRGPVPDGLVLDHLCRNRACCNPDHLEPVTHRENVARGEARARRPGERCARGHVVHAGGRCIACRSERQREWYQRARATAKAIAGEDYTAELVRAADLATGGTS